MRPGHCCGVRHYRSWCPILICWLYRILSPDWLFTSTYWSDSYLTSALTTVHIAYSWKTCMHRRIDQNHRVISDVAFLRVHWLLLLTYDSQCQGISNLPAWTTETLADIQSYLIYFHFERRPESDVTITSSCSRSQLCHLTRKNQNRATWTMWCKSRVSFFLSVKRSRGLYWTPLVSTV